MSALSGGSYGDTDFPIFVSKTHFRKYGKPRIRRLPRATRDAIEALQPYNRPNPDDAPLAILNRLAREDKHRSAAFKIAAFASGGMEFQPARDIEGYGEVVIYGGRMENGDPLADIEVIPSGPNPELHIKTNFRGAVAFGEGWLLPNPLPSVIEEVRNVVAKLT